MAETQSLQALNVAWAARARVKTGRQRLIAGELALADVLADPPADDVVAQLQRVELARVLVWLPRVGDATAARILEAARVLPTARIHALTTAQRVAIARATDVYRPERP